ncbi:MAG: hypothetical protein HOY69_40605 [Streptomyces sp.]|nr:hypothetical protein [Streptomyces sp.]
MSAEIAQLVEQAGPYLTAAVGAYGAAVLARAEDAAADVVAGAVTDAADATAGLGRRLLHAVWRRGDPRGRTALEDAVRDAADEPDDADAAAALRQQLKRALREDAELRAEIAALVGAPAQGSVTVTASGTRAIAAQNIGVAVTGDHATVHPPAS